MTSPSVSVETQKVGGGYKFLGGIALTVAAVMAVVILFSHRGLYYVYRFGHERVRLEQENARLAAENARLARTIDRLQHDPPFIQDLIRQELNFVKKNEIIFQFTPDKPASRAELSGKGEAAPPAKVNAISARQVGKSNWVSPPAEESGKKGAGPQHE
ncbi:MAG: septum formation initiator family protein [Desulfobaccales bacterium]